MFFWFLISMVALVVDVIYEVHLYKKERIEQQKAYRLFHISDETVLTKKDHV